VRSSINPLKKYFHASIGGASIIGLSFYISITECDFMDMLRARASEKPVFKKA